MNRLRNSVDSDVELLVRVPGFEPGFKRWQRSVITTTLHSCEIRETRLTFLSVGLLSREPLEVVNNGVTSAPIDFDCPTNRIV